MTSLELFRLLKFKNYLYFTYIFTLSSSEMYEGVSKSFEPQAFSPFR